MSNYQLEAEKLISRFHRNHSGTVHKLLYGYGLSVHETVMYKFIKDNKLTVDYNDTEEGSIAASRPYPLCGPNGHVFCTHGLLDGLEDQFIIGVMYTVEPCKETAS